MRPTLPSHRLRAQCSPAPPRVSQQLFFPGALVTEQNILDLHGVLARTHAVRAAALHHSVAREAPCKRTCQRYRHECRLLACQGLRTLFAIAFGLRFVLFGTLLLLDILVPGLLHAAALESITVPWARDRARKGRPRIIPGILRRALDSSTHPPRRYHCCCDYRCCRLSSSRPVAFMCFSRFPLLSPVLLSLLKLHVHLSTASEACTSQNVRNRI